MLTGRLHFDANCITLCTMYDVWQHATCLYRDFLRPYECMRHVLPPRRNPVPSYYSITMEMMRDRTTAIKTTICDHQNPDSVKCPDDYLDGDKYRYRTLNDHCLKYVSPFSIFVKFIRLFEGLPGHERIRVLSISSAMAINKLSVQIISAWWNATWGLNLNFEFEWWKYG